MESKHRYFVFPGDVTGDSWHVAAAQILSKDVAYVAAIIISHGDVDHGDWTHARTTFDYLRGIGLPCFLIKIEAKYYKAEFERSTYRLPVKFYEVAYKIQSGEHFRDMDFESLAKMEPEQTQLERVKKMTEGKLPILGNGTELLALMNATNIAMVIWHDSNAEGRATLAERLSLTKDEMTEAATEKAAQDKYNALKALAGNSPIILENFRAGHVNAGTDSNGSLSDYFYSAVQEAFKKEVKVVTILSVNNEAKFNELKNRLGKRGLFDLYDKLKEGRWEPSWPGLEPRIQARFWKKVAEDDQIIGLFGGRSGSLDIAAFCGVRTFFWDEPWVEFGFGANADLPVSPNNVDKAYEQVPQCLRSLQLAGLMSIGYPKGKPAKPGKPWLTIRDGAFESWLKSERGSLICPSCPEGENWQMVNSIRDYRKAFLERPDLGIEGVLDRLKYDDDGRGPGVSATPEAKQKERDRETLAF